MRLLAHPGASQIPKQLAAIFTSAAAQNFNTPVTSAAFCALDSFLGAACDAGISSGSLGSSIREQLQQPGVLQQLSALLSAMTAELEAETAALAAGGWAAASGHVHKFDADDALQPRFGAVVNNNICFGGSGKLRGYPLVGCGVPLALQPL